MGRDGKVTVIILIILLIASLAVAGGVYYLFQQEQAKNISLQKQLDDVTERQRVTEKQLQESLRTAADIGNKLKTTQAELSSLNEELKAAKADREAALNTVEELKRSMEQANSERSNLEGRLTAANQDIKKSQDSLKEMQDQKTALETKIKELQAQVQGVELGKIVVNPETSSQATVRQAQPAKEKKGFFGFGKKKAVVQKAAPVEMVKATPAAPVPSGHEGKVLVINKEYNFAVINLGSRDGLRVGDTFAAYHNGSYIGDLVIEKLHDSMAAANFANPGIKDSLAEGDRILQKK